MQAPIEVQNDQQALAAPTDAQRMLNVALSYEIDSQAMLDAAGKELSGIVARKKAITEKRMEITRPMDAAKKAVMDFFAGPINLLEQAESALKQGMLKYEDGERRRIEAERRAAEEKARKEREEAERIAREAEKAAAEAAASGNEEAQQEAAAQAEVARAQAELTLFAPPPVVDDAPTASSASFRSTWKGRVTDKAALIKAAASRPELQGLLEVSETALNGMARAVKNSAPVPGVEFYEVRNVASRSR